MAALDLWLDSYDDIYSDFDNRHYLKRRVSEDFLYELQYEMKYKEHNADNLVLLLPPERRNEQSEKLISDSLGCFFRAQYRLYKNKCRRKFINGVILFVAGAFIMIVNSWLHLRLGAGSRIINIMILLEPAGWFLVWAGLDLLFYGSGVQRRERDFFKKLSEVHIWFKSA